MTIENLIEKGASLPEIADIEKLENEYEAWRRDINVFFRQGKYSEETLAEGKVNMHYEKNEYSKESARDSLIRAVRKTILYLKNLPETSAECMPAEIAFQMIEKVLDNFYLYYRTMYRAPVHKRGTLTQETVESIKIGNEYDLQRMMYSLLIPLFPTARKETANDGGYGGMRADIYLEEYKLIIETKCTREHMTEKKLLEELGADAFLYRADTIFFFVYDPMEIIKNPEALKKSFYREKEKEGKRIRLFVLQPVVFT